MAAAGRPVTVPIERLAHGRNLPLPAYATNGSAGLDLMAAIATTVELAPGARTLVPAGITLALPAGYEAQIRPRSGLALKHGITVLNSPGTIDSDYRGEIKVLLVNHGGDAFRIEPGMRIAQLVVAPVVRIAWAEDAVQPASERGDGGYGSTGVAAR
ncbi:MAG: dUTP diphosphatase [Dongiaceae bacterium]